MLNIAKYQPVYSLEEINIELEKLNFSIESLEDELIIISNMGVESITDKMKKAISNKMSSLINKFDIVDNINKIKFKTDLDLLIKENNEYKNSTDKDELNKRVKYVFGEQEIKEIGSEKLIILGNKINRGKTENNIDKIPDILSFITNEIKSVINGDTSKHELYLKEKENMGIDRHVNKPLFATGILTKLELSNLFIKLCKEAYSKNNINLELIKNSSKKINNLDDVNKVKESLTLLKILHDLSLYFTNLIFTLALAKEEKNTK